MRVGAMVMAGRVRVGVDELEHGGSSRLESCCVE